jgi:predicted RNA-binding Zn ribbon-like protein
MATLSKEAPGDLDVVRAFVNSLDLEHEVEQLDTPQALVGWLADQGLIERHAKARPGDVHRAVLLREALRELLLSNNDGHQLPLEVGRTLNDVAARARLRLHLDASGTAHLRAEGDTVDAALGRLLVIVYRAMENDTWPRLKACREDTCRWAFYDHSKNRSGHWCSMEVCGSRHKARQYRERRKSGGRA